MTFHIALFQFRDDVASGKTGLFGLLSDAAAYPHRAEYIPDAAGYHTYESELVFDILPQKLLRILQISVNV